MFKVFGGGGMYSVCNAFLLLVTVKTLHLSAWNFIFHSAFQSPLVVRPSVMGSDDDHVGFGAVGEKSDDCHDKFRISICIVQCGFC